MSKSKPDAFAQRVEQKQFFVLHPTNSAVPIVLAKDVVTLLRAYHAKVIQIVKRQPVRDHKIIAGDELINRDDLLAALAQMKRGDTSCE